MYMSNIEGLVIEPVFAAEVSLLCSADARDIGSASQTDSSIIPRLYTNNTNLINFIDLTPLKLIVNIFQAAKKEQSFSNC